MTESQTKRIKTALLKGQRVTPISALEQFGCFRLAARIADLKAEGTKIDSRMVKNRHGTRYAEYWYRLEG